MSNEVAAATTRDSAPPAPGTSTGASGPGARVQLKRALSGQGHDVQASMLRPDDGPARVDGNIAAPARDADGPPVQRSTRNIQRTGPAAGTAGMTDTAPAPPIGADLIGDVKRYCAPDPIAMQKLSDVDGESYMDPGKVAPDVARQGFYRKVGDYINTNHATLQPSTIYNACFNNAAGSYKMSGQKIDPATVGGLCSRTSGAPGFWDRQIDQTIFINEAATELGLPASDPDVLALARAKFFAKAQAGGDLMPYLKTGGMVAPEPYPAWFTPDKVRIDASSDTAFGDLMRVYALQPEWFAQGNVAFEVDPTVHAGGKAQELRKPTAYDGMQSSLWVARNQGGETYGMTGGGAREFLAQNVSVAAIKSCRGVIPSQEFLGQLTTLQSRAVAKFLETNPQIKAEMDALEARIATLPDTDPNKKTAQDRLKEIKNWIPNLTDWVLRGQTTFLTSHIGVKIRDAKAVLDSVSTTTSDERAGPTPMPTTPVVVNPA